MQHAIQLSKTNLGQTYPNPTVGCIITDNDNNVLSYGITSTYGRPHAEENAINKLTSENKLLAKKMFITIEPCCYSSTNTRTPCVELIKNLQINEIYIGLPDPNPNIATKSIEILKKSGVNVRIGICHNEILTSNFGFFKKHLLKLPEISYKIATSLDGKIACKNGHSKWITNEKSRNFAHKIRSENEAILTTSQTIIADNPLLNVRNIDIKTQPVKIVIDRNLKLFTNQFNWNIFNGNTKNPYCKSIIIVCKKDNENIILLERIFPQIHFLKLEDFSPINIFHKITENFSFSKILIEAGGKFLTSLIKENLIDKLYWFNSSKIIGNDGIPAIENLDLTNLEENFNFKLQKLININGDSMRTFINEKNYNVIKNHQFFDIKSLKN